MTRSSWGEEAIPDHTTILNFRHLLEEHRLTEAMFVEVNALLEERGLLLRSGSIVDATIIEAPSSTKNQSGQRDPEMKQTRKGKNWYIAGASDVQEMGALLHGEERELNGDQPYWSEPLRQQCEAAGIRYWINRRPTAATLLTQRWRKINRARSRTRARGEHPYQVLKHVWGFRKTRYRGLEKNRVRLCGALALVNLYRMRRRLPNLGETCLR